MSAEHPFRTTVLAHRAAPAGRGGAEVFMDELGFPATQLACTITQVGSGVPTLNIISNSTGSDPVVSTELGPTPAFLLSWLTGTPLVAGSTLVMATLSHGAAAVSVKAGVNSTSEVKVEAFDADGVRVDFTGTIHLLIMIF